MTHPYNTALGSGDQDELRRSLSDTSFYASSKGTVFEHDAMLPLPQERLALARRCDCVYSDPPWPAGWRLFHARAGAPAPIPYPAYLDAVERLVAEIARPTYLVCSKRLATRFGGPLLRPILLRGGIAWLAVAHAPAPPAELSSAEALLGWLSRRHRSVYDFNCGYGSALRRFRYAVGSDIDRKCLNYIARELL